MEDEDVRNWATFGLGSQADIDTAEIRAALLERVTDSHNETRGEALVGLARRKDPRALEPIIQELRSEHIGILALEAAETLGDPRLLPALLRLEHDWQRDEDDHVKTLRDALAKLFCPRTLLICEYRFAARQSKWPRSRLTINH